MNNNLLLETVADIAFYAGHRKYSTTDSRNDIQNFIAWAREFEKVHKGTDWDSNDYILSVEEFTDKKILFRHKRQK